MKRRLRIVLAVAGALLLWAAFWAYGWNLHVRCADAPVNRFGWVSIAGFDSEWYLGFFLNIFHLFAFFFRHPLINFLFFPAYVIGPQVAVKFGPEAAKFAVLGFFTLFSVANVLLLGWLTRSRLAVLLWLSFGYTWIVGGIAESFGPSTTFLLICLLLVQKGVRDWRIWTALSFLTGGMTLTNGLKAWMVAVMMIRNRRRVLTVMAVTAGAMLLLCGAVMLKWVYLDGLTVAQGFAWTVGDAFRTIDMAMDLPTRFRMYWEAFYLEPIWPHGEILARDTITFGYATILPHVFGALLLALCLWSGWRNRRDPVVRALGLMLSVDFLLHIILSWGLPEAQIYCAHWLFAIPVLIARLLRSPDGGPPHADAGL